MFVLLGGSDQSKDTKMATPPMVGLPFKTNQRFSGHPDSGRKLSYSARSRYAAFWHGRAWGGSLCICVLCPLKGPFLQKPVKQFLRSSLNLPLGQARVTVSREASRSGEASLVMHLCKPQLNSQPPVTLPVQQRLDRNATGTMTLSS